MISPNNIYYCHELEVGFTFVKREKHVFVSTRMVLHSGPLLLQKTGKKHNQWSFFKDVKCSNSRSMSLCQTSPPPQMFQLDNSDGMSSGLEQILLLWAERICGFLNVLHNEIPQSPLTALSAHWTAQHFLTSKYNTSRTTSDSRLLNTLVFTHWHLRSLSLEDLMMISHKTKRVNKNILPIHHTNTEGPQ